MPIYFPDRHWSPLTPTDVCDYHSLIDNTHHLPAPHKKPNAVKKDSRLKQSQKNAPPIIFVFLIVFELYQHWSICNDVLQKLYRLQLRILLSVYVLYTSTPSSLWWSHTDPASLLTRIIITVVISFPRCADHTDMVFAHTTFSRSDDHALIHLHRPHESSSLCS